MTIINNNASVCPYWNFQAGLETRRTTIETNRKVNLILKLQRARPSIFRYRLLYLISQVTCKFIVQEENVIKELFLVYLV
jgi:hypothetical protein